MKILLGMCFVVSARLLECLGIDPVDEGNPRRTFHTRRAIDGTRGRKYYEPIESDAFDFYDSDRSFDYDENDDFSDIRRNVPGEPGIDYPTYRRIPQTSFTCDSRFRGYYADEEAGCQLFHICDGNFRVSSFLCPMGSTFSQKLLTCDWWNKVDCSLTKKYYVVNDDESPLSQVDDDEILRKAYEMTSLQSTSNGITAESKNQGKFKNSNSHVNDLQSGTDRVSDYSDVSSNLNIPHQRKFSSRYSAQEFHDRDIDFYPIVGAENQQNPSIKVHTIGEDYKNDAVDDQVNNVRPSYRPTVPTVTTTTRRYYSPTVPATTASSIKNHKFDLEFESSDHLYSARGKSPVISSTSTTISPITAATIEEKTSSLPDVFPTLSDASSSKVDQISSPVFLLNIPETEIKKENNNDKTRLSDEFNRNEFDFGSLDLGINSPDEEIRSDLSIGLDDRGNVFIPATEITPPFFYYSNVDQHHSLAHKITAIEESNATTSWYDNDDFDIPATDIIPPLLYHKINSNDSEESSLDYQITPPITKIIPQQFKDSRNLQNSSLNQEINLLFSSNENKTFINNENITENIATPSKIFLTPFFDSILQNSSDAIQNYERRLSDRENFRINSEVLSSDYEKNLADGELVDSVGGESTPYRVTLNINQNSDINHNEDLMKSLNPAKINNTGIENYDEERISKVNDSMTFPIDEFIVANIENDQKGEGSRPRSANYHFVNKSNSKSRIKFITPGNIKIDPRPFSLSSPKNINIVPRSDIGKSLPSSYVNSESQKNFESSSVTSNIIDNSFGLKLNIKKNNSLDEEKLSEPKKVEIIKNLSRTFGRASQSKSSEQIIFELPHVIRNFDFQSGRNNEAKNEEQKDEKNDKGSSSTLLKSVEMPRESFRVETEFIPSLAFSLNTDEEREKYMEAVKNGLFADISIPSSSSKSKNDTEN